MLDNYYEKNMQQLLKTDPSLYKKLQKLKDTTKYELFASSHENSYNIFDTKSQEFLYENPVEAFNTDSKTFESYVEYPYLYMYGIGNGQLANKALENKKLSRLVVIEPNIEILFIALNLSDFSQAIEKRRLLFLQAVPTFAEIVKILNYHRAKFYARVFFLHIHSDYYLQHHSKDIQKWNEAFVRGFKHIFMLAGNDVIDSLIGIKNTIKALPDLICNPPVFDLVKQRKKDTAILVATGPSLKKQIPLLKEIAPYATIFSVDASLPVLEKEGIKPDIVTTIERIELTSTFFSSVSEEFKKDIVFALAALAHPKSIEHTKAGTQTFILRPFDYCHYFGLNDSGYLGSGQSTANLAHELALNVGFKRVILIGQDLAYGEDGLSHTDGHILGSDEIKRKASDILVPAYGGKGKVYSTIVWKSFLNSYEQAVEHFKTNFGYDTINATEGGARIEGTIEMSFKEAIEKYIDSSTQKEKIKLLKPSKDVVRKKKTRIKQKMNHLFKESEKLQQIIEKTFLKIAAKSKAIEGLEKQEMLDAFNQAEVIDLLNTIENTRNQVMHNPIMQKFYYDSIRSHIVNDEAVLAELKVEYAVTQEERHEKAVKWILAHRMWLFNMAGAIHNILETVKEEYNKYNW